MLRRRGFTLIELMVVVSIIAVLASMLLFGLSKVQSRAMSAKTKSTIVKLHDLIMQRWNSYRTRRLPVDTRGMAPKDAAELRLVALRQLMRLEMPDTWAEVTTAPGQLTRVNGTAFSPAPPIMPTPALALAYQRYYNTVSVGKTPNNLPTNQFQNAECLYMIVTVGAQDEASGRELFTESEIGDVDGDGAPEFIDAWGMPIRFLRWPVGFVDDPRQDADASHAHFGHLSDLMPAKAPQNATAPLTPCMPDAYNNHDPFDPRRIDPVAFNVIPLIYSSGPDGIQDIYSGVDTAVYDDPFKDLRADSNPCAAYDPLATFVDGTASVGTPKLIGIPHDLLNYKYGNTQNANGVLNHYDNIHNQRIDATGK